MQPKTFLATDHDIDPSLIDPDAIYVLSKLRKAGFMAYLVGGSVRDLLIKKRPKDFDISTSARPEQIKSLFQRNCILIGRRFRLAHIRFGRKIFEVSTFRSGLNESDLIIQDNQWGTPEEDVLRRDFTINGLFYDPETHTIIDYVGGWDDIHQRTLRSIGDPIVRFRQDPVRMIRLLKFKARFGFEMDKQTINALTSCKDDIVRSSPARILEEIFRMLESGASAPFFHLMTEHGILELLFPCLTHFLKEEFGKTIYRYLACADKLNLNFGPNALGRSVLSACLIFPILEKEIQTQFLDKNEIPHIGDIMMMTTSIIKGVVTSSFSHFPRKISTLMSFILTTQYRLTPLKGKRTFRIKLVKNKEFSLALKFLKLRSMADPQQLDDYNAWKKIYRQHEHHGERRPHPHHPPQSKTSHAHRDSDHAG